MENQNEQIDIMTAQTVGVTEAQSRAEIDIQITTAKKYPRNTFRAIENIVALVSQDKELANSCVYSLPRAGKEITGASVHLARLIASEYGNIRVQARIVEIGDNMITAQAVAFDLEKNYAVNTEVKRRITDKTGQRFKDDMIVVTCNAALSIASRNAILQVIPTTLTGKVLKAAQNAILGDLTDEQKLFKRRKEVFDGFLNSYNVTEVEILALLEIETINQVKEGQILTLIGLANAIKDGDTTVAEAFGRTKQSNVAKETKAKVNEAIEKAKAKKKPQVAAPSAAADPGMTGGTVTPIKTLKFILE
jgi:hypothetical protein